MTHCAVPTRLRVALYIFIWSSTVGVWAQRNATFEAYINQFAAIAVDQMQRHGIPASITLAQGLLESGAGTSRLATKGNNHFGIKTGGDWTGPYMLRDDDAPNERFRVYGSPVQSYEDHSLFLTTRSRYASLFSLSRTDYKGWAHGLKAAGYATSPTYAERLITLIETYDLTRFDRQALAQTNVTTSSTTSSPVVNTNTPAGQVGTVAGSRVLMENGAYYVIAQQGDTYRTIGRCWGVRTGSLRRYNEQRSGYEPQPGERVYLVKKPARAAKQYKGRCHVVAAGETLHGIAQRYAVRTRTLYRLNRLPDTYTPRVGDRIRLR